MGSRLSNPSVKPGQKNPIDSNTIRSSSLRDYTPRRSGRTVLPFRSPRVLSWRLSHSVMPTRLGGAAPSRGTTFPPAVRSERLGKGRDHRSSTLMAGGPTQRIEARLLFIAQRTVKFRERRLHSLHRPKLGVKLLLHRLDPTRGGQHLV